ncbi:MAG TPA: methyltransferase domain-containing protein [Erythrobacter sp.]|nr:methyltransferase domain-containing protein [Erythrobacter sp.]
MNTRKLSNKAARRPSRRGRRFFEQAAIFFRGFIEHPAMVASVIPSSRSTIEAMLARLDWQGCRLFVEYGPGVGTFTTHILDRLPADGKLLAIDTNPRFVDYLRETIDDPRFEVVLGSAADVESFVRAAGHTSADFIISGLPFSSLPADVAEDIVAASYRVMRDGGAFMTYQFKPTARELTQARFERIDTGLALMNVPPCLLTWGWKHEAQTAREAAE